MLRYAALCLFVQLAHAEVPLLKRHDADFAKRAASDSSDDADIDGDGDSDERAVIASIAIFIALLGFIVAFFVGYYVGTATTRRVPTVVRATPYIVETTAQPETSHRQISISQVQQHITIETGVSPLDNYRILKRN